jgi:hypothetical protein
MARSTAQGPWLTRLLTIIVHGAKERPFEASPTHADTCSTVGIAHTCSTVGIAHTASTVGIVHTASTVGEDRVC